MKRPTTKMRPDFLEVSIVEALLMIRWPETYLGAHGVERWQKVHEITRRAIADVESMERDG